MLCHTKGLFGDWSYPISHHSTTSRRSMARLTTPIFHHDNNHVIATSLQFGTHGVGVGVGGCAYGKRSTIEPGGILDMATTAMNSKQRPAMRVSKQLYIDECFIWVKYLLLIIFDFPEYLSFHFILVLKVLDIFHFHFQIFHFHTPRHSWFSSSNAAGRNNQPAARVEGYIPVVLAPGLGVGSWELYLFYL